MGGAPFKLAEAVDSLARRRGPLASEGSWLVQNQVYLAAYSIQRSGVGGVEKRR